MKAGMSLMELAAKVEADVARQQDLIVDTRELTMLTSAEGGSTITLPNDSDLFVQHHAHRQIGQRLGIRADFYDRLRQDYPGQHAALVNTMFKQVPLSQEGNGGKKVKGRFTPDKFMLRTYTDGGPNGEGVARAFLSDNYHRVDHHVILQAILPVLGELKDAGHEVRVESAEVTDSKLYVKVVVPTISYDLNDYIDPHKHTAPDVPGTGGSNVVQLGLVFSNSEVGTGAFDVQKLLYKLTCRNGLIMGSLMSRRHIGRKVEANEDYTVYQSDTLKADAEALRLKIRDVTKAFVDEMKFELLVKEFASAADTKPIEQPIKGMEALAPVVGLTGVELTKATEHLLRDGDMTKFGAVNAITRMAQDVEGYDRSTELEELAYTTVLRMPVKDWDAIATAF